MAATTVVAVVAVVADAAAAVEAGVVQRVGLLKTAMMGVAVFVVVVVVVFVPEESVRQSHA